MIKNTRELKQHNKYIVLNEIIERQPVSRKILSQVLDVSTATISSIITELSEDGLVVETEFQESTGGRPPRLVEFRGNNKYVISVELSYTYVSYAIYDLDFTLKKSSKWDVLGESAEQIIEKLYQDIFPGFFQIEDIKFDDIIGMGISVPGIYNNKEDILTSSISEIWQDTHIKKAFNKRFDIPLFIENDANISTYYESAYGVGVGYSNLIYIFIAEGIGSGLVINNELYRGAHGIAGEISHIKSNEQDIPCECGNTGCLEVTSSMSAIRREVIDNLKAGKKSQLQRESIDSISNREIVEAYQEGDLLCRSIIDQSVEYFINTLSGLVNFLDPDLIVLGDIYNLYNQEMISRINDRIRDLSFADRGSTPRVVQKSKEDLFQLIAAARYVFDKWKYTV